MSDDLEKGAALFARFVARAILDELRPMLSEQRADDLVDRRTAGISGRQWDRWVHDGTLRVMKDGRRYVAKRSDVLLALERERKFAPKAEPRDEGAQLLATAGVRTGGAR